MRFVFVGDFGVSWSTERFVADALARAEHDVKRIGGHRAEHYGETYYAVKLALADNARRFPSERQVLLFSKLSLAGRAFGTPEGAACVEDFAELTRGFGGLVACWCWDLLAPGFHGGRARWASRVAKACDAFFTTDGYTAPHLANSVVLRQGFPGPADELRRGTARTHLRCLLAHFGGNYGLRKRWCDNLRAAWPRHFRVWNNQHGDVLFDICRSASIVLGPPWPAYQGYFSNRLYHITGYGGCFACPTVDGMAEEGWVPGVNYLPLTDDYVRELRAYLQRPREELRGVADAGQAHTFANFTYDYRVKTLVEHLEKIACQSAALAKC